MNISPFPERNARIAAMYREGVKLKDISDPFGISRQRVQQIAWAAGVPRRHPVAREIRVCPVCGAEHERLPSSRAVHCSLLCGNRSGKQGGRPKYTDADLIASLAGLGRKLGRTPNSFDMNADPDTASQTTYVMRFGSVQAAQVAAGLTPNGVGGPGHAKATETA